jgi:succinoglycan biosynthesis protein ExoA
VAVFRRLQGYDEDFSHNEDAEFDHRLTAAGERIFLCADAPVDYYPRTSAAALTRQYYNHGRGRAHTLIKHRVRPNLRQMLPPAVVFGSVAALCLAPVAPTVLALPVFYAGACQCVAVVAALRRRDKCLLLLGVAAMIMHSAWAVGFLRGLFERFRQPKGRAPSAVSDVEALAKASVDLSSCSGVPREL